MKTLMTQFKYKTRAFLSKTRILKLKGIIKDIKNS
jgi:hypothetical protein